jgi:hypothetical protein
VEVQVNLGFIYFDWHSPSNPTTLEDEFEGLLKSFLVETRGMFTQEVFTRNSDMILVLTVRLCRASMFVPLNEQAMIVEGKRIRIALEERFTFINHSFDGSTLGEASLGGCVSFLCQKSFEVLPQSSISIGNSE